jgi:hypothetical protein
LCCYTWFYYTNKKQMLNLILRKKVQNNIHLENKYNELDREKTSKHFPSSTREWKDSVYTFNKNNLNLIPSADLNSINIIKSFYSLFNSELEKKLRTKRLSTKYRKLSLNKIYISNGEFKHTNNKVIINLYIFNRQHKNYSIILKKLKSKLVVFFKQSKNIFSSRFNILSKRLLSLNKMSLFKITNSNTNLRKNYNIKIYLENYYNKLINNERKKRLLYLYYRQLIYINKSKFTYIYLQYLKEQLSKLYNKDIEFNIINLKRFYLNSYILSDSITRKIRRNRKKTMRYLKTLTNKIKVKTINTYFHKHKKNNKLEEKLNLTTNSNKIIINKLKYKDITGFRVEATGRLTRRNTASRSISKLSYKGNLLNIDSSLKGISSVILKGNLKSNVEHTKLASKSRIGSFGIKGWISGN